MTNKNAIIRKTKKVIQKYRCKVRPLSATERDELRLRIATALSEINS